MVRDRARKKRDVVKGVEEFVNDFYSSNAADFQSSLFTLLQGFFMALDTAVVFNHLLTDRQITDLVQWGIDNLTVRAAPAR
jgi:hypothetical protein